MAWTEWGSALENFISTSSKNKSWMDEKERDEKSPKNKLTCQLILSETLVKCKRQCNEGITMFLKIMRGHSKL